MESDVWFNWFHDLNKATYKEIPQDFFPIKSISASLQVEHTEHHGLKREAGMTRYEASPRLGHLLHGVISKCRVTKATVVCARWIAH